MEGELRITVFSLFLVVAFVLGILQSAVLTEILPEFVRPDLVLPLVVYLGIVLSPVPGAVLVLFCGFIYDCYSGTPFGLYMFADLTIFFVLKVVAKFLIMGEALILRLILLAFAAAVQVCLFILVPNALGLSGNLEFPSLNRLLGHVAFTCAVGWPVFIVLRIFENAMRPEPSGANS